MINGWKTRLALSPLLVDDKTLKQMAKVIAHPGHCMNFKTLSGGSQFSHIKHKAGAHRA